MYSEYYPAVASRVVEKVVTLPVGKPVTKAQDGTALHELTLHPRHPGIVFEKIVVDFGGYKASHLFQNESSYTKEK
jgi:hypothetical protein